MSDIEKQVAILGGSFDPPTIAHFQTASEIYNKIPYIDEVWLLPCGDYRSDKNLKASAMQRTEMLNLGKKDILDDNFLGVIISDYEVKNGKYLPSYELLNNLKKDYPKYKFYFSIGSDLLEGLSRWDNSKKLIDENDIIIVLRDSYIIRQNTIRYAEILPCDIYGSSTSIRNRIQENNTTKKFNIEGLTSKSIIEYIQKNKLYIN